MEKQLVIHRLKEIVGQKYVLSSDMDLALYSYDASLERAMPDVVVLPDTTEEVSKIMALSQSYSFSNHGIIRSILLLQWAARGRVQPLMIHL